MEYVAPGLHASPPMSPDFAPQSSVRAFPLERPDGNVLLYASERVRADDSGVAALDGIDTLIARIEHGENF